jgi:hypothetical protein
MLVPTLVKIETKVKGFTEVFDGELHALLCDGQVSLTDAVSALKNAGLKLDQKVYPWLREAPKDEPKPVVTEQPEPDIAEVEDNPEGA